jgi:RNA polymerase sigma-70 factor (ECF subfamily)
VHPADPSRPESSEDPSDPGAAEGLAALLSRARTGDSGALEELLWSHYDRLLLRIQRRIPVAQQAIVAADDVLQETLMTVWQQLGQFEAQTDAAFSAWLSKIADSRLSDRLRAAGTKKRGGDRVQATAANSELNLLDALGAAGLTPSGTVARREAERIVRIALAELKPDYRQAIQLRYLQGLSVDAVAQRMGRTDRSVHMLCNRAIKRLRDALGRSSMYLSKHG